MAELKIAQTEAGDFEIHGDGYDPQSLIHVEQAHYRPTDGTGGRNFGFSVLAITDDVGAFTVTWSRLFVVGTRHAPGELDMTVVGNPASATALVT